MNIWVIGTEIRIWFLLILIISLRGCPAHSQDLPDKPEVITVSKPTFGNVEVSLSRCVTFSAFMPCQNEHWKELLPVPHETKDRSFWASTVLSVAFTVADVENSVYALRDPSVYEVNPLYGSHPGRGRYYAISLPIAAVSAYLSYRYKREDDALKHAGIQGHKYSKWWIPNAMNMGSHIFGIIYTLTSTRHLPSTFVPSNSVLLSLCTRCVSVAN